MCNMGYNQDREEKEKQEMTARNKRPYYVERERELHGLFTFPVVAFAFYGYTFCEMPSFE